MPATCSPERGLPGRSRLSLRAGAFSPSRALARNHAVAGALLGTATYCSPVSRFVADGALAPPSGRHSFCLLISRRASSGASACGRCQRRGPAPWRPVRCRRRLRRILACSMSAGAAPGLPSRERTTPALLSYFSPRDLDLDGRQAGIHTLPDHAALELGERPGDLEEQLAGRCGRVDSRYRSTPQASKCWIVPSRSIRGRPSRSIAHTITHVEAPPAGGLEHGIQARALIAAFGSADTCVPVDLDDFPTNGAQRPGGAR